MGISPCLNCLNCHVDLDGHRSYRLLYGKGSYPSHSWLPRHIGPRSQEEIGSTRPQHLTRDLLVSWCVYCSGLISGKKKDVTQCFFVHPILLSISLVRRLFEVAIDYPKLCLCDMEPLSLLLVMGHTWMCIPGSKGWMALIHNATLYACVCVYIYIYIYIYIYVCE